MPLGQPMWQFGRADVEQPGDGEADCHHDRRQECDGEGHVVDVVENFVPGAGEQRSEPELLVAFSDEGALEHDTGEQRAGGQYEQRHQHHNRRFVDMMHDIRGGTRLAVERHENQAPRIEAGQQRRQNRQTPAIGREGIIANESRFDDGVLGEITRRERKAGQRQRADHHQPVSDRDMLLEPTHAPHVLLVGDSVDHGTGA